MGPNRGAVLKKDIPAFGRGKVFIWSISHEFNKSAAAFAANFYATRQLDGIGTSGSYILDQRGAHNGTPCCPNLFLGYLSYHVVLSLLSLAVRAGRGCFLGHLIIWVGAVRPKIAIP